jgi:hypothetical protein
MITATEEFWDFERATFDDELDAWRARTAAPESRRAAQTGRAVALRPAGLPARPASKARAPRSTRHALPGGRVRSEPRHHRTPERSSGRVG